MVSRRAIVDVADMEKKGLHAGICNYIKSNEGLRSRLHDFELQLTDWKTTYKYWRDQCLDLRAEVVRLKEDVKVVYGDYENAVEHGIRHIQEVERLQGLQEEREADMHVRIRNEYDKTVADCWRAKVAEVEAEVSRLRPLAMRWEAVASELGISISPDEEHPGDVAVFDIREVKAQRDEALEGLGLKRAAHMKIELREACRRRTPISGTDAQALEHAITITEQERDALQAERGTINELLDASTIVLPAESLAERVMDLLAQRNRLKEAYSDPDQYIQDVDMLRTAVANVLPFIEDMNNWVPAMAEEAGWDDEDDNEQMTSSINRHAKALRAALNKED